MIWALMRLEKSILMLRGRVGNVENLLDNVTLHGNMER